MKKKLNNKKTIIKTIGILAVLVLAVIFIAKVAKDNNRLGYTEISYSQLTEKVNNKDDFVLFIGRETCSACSMYKKILNSRFKTEYKNVTIYYIDLDKLSDEESATFNSTYDYSVTPTTVVLTDGKVQSTIDKVTGADCYDDLIGLLTRKGIIKG